MGLTLEEGPVQAMVGRCTMEGPLPSRVSYYVSESSATFPTFSSKFSYYPTLLTSFRGIGPA